MPGKVDVSQSRFKAGSGSRRAACRAGTYEAASADHPSLRLPSAFRIGNERPMFVAPHLAGRPHIA
jgi:hypothetical protein